MARSSTNLIIIHCSATKPSQDIGVKEIDRWHRARGFFKVGYHWIIRRDGEVEKGRDLLEPGAHAKGYNDRSIGICLVGGVHETKMQGRWPAPEDNFTEAQWETLDTLVDQMKDQFPEAGIIGHNEVAAKACPSFDVQKWLKERKLDENDTDGRAPLVSDKCPCCGQSVD